MSRTKPLGPSLAQIVNAQNRIALMRRVPGCRGSLSVEHISTISYALGCHTTSLLTAGERIDESALEHPAEPLVAELGRASELDRARAALDAIGGAVAELLSIELAGCSVATCEQRRFDVACLTAIRNTVDAWRAGK